MANTIYLDLDKLKGCYVSTPKCKKIYLDTTMVWQGATPIARPTSAQLNPSGTYSGSSISNGFSMTGVEYVSGSTSGTNVGTYVAYYRPDSEHIWADTEDREQVAVTLTINAKLLTIPSLTNATKNYTGSALSPTVNNFSSTYETQSGTASATNGGTYTITWALKNTTNTKWSDGTTANKTATWTIQYVWTKWSVNTTYSKVVTNYTAPAGGSYQYKYDSSSGFKYTYKNGNTNYLSINQSTGKFELSSGYSASKWETNTASFIDATTGSNSFGAVATTSSGKVNSFSEVLVGTASVTWKTSYKYQKLYNDQDYDYVGYVWSISASYSKGTTQYANVTSTTSSTAYPANGKSGNYWYVKTW